MHHSKKLGTLRFNDVTSTRTSKKTIGLISKTTTLHVHHALLYISLPFVHDYGVKMPNFVFYGMENVNKQRRNYLSLPELEWCLGIQIQSLMPFTASLVWPFSIINRVEQLWPPSDSFVICFCGLEGAQRSITSLSFWSYLPINTLFIIYSVTFW